MRTNLKNWLAACLSTACLVTTSMATAHESVQGDGILPENNLHLRDIHSNSDVTEQVFNDILDQIENIYAPIVSYHGATLSVVRRWSDNTVNAYASRSGNTWKIEMFGGLARAPEVTPDGFALVACHEMGHHLGGFPFKSGRWASSEGQSDYFATQACARQLWELEDNSSAGQSIPIYARIQCNNAWTDQDDRELCYRTALAGKSLAQLLAASSGSNVDFNTPDTSVVSETNTNHPAAQCRLDTYFQGSLCDVKFDNWFIPGLNADLGSASLYAEMEAGYTSCSAANYWLGFPDANTAYRPKCWYKNRFTDGSNFPFNY